jgi:hypothetical protein
MKLIDVLVMISKGELKEGTKIIFRDELYTLKKKELTKGYGINPTFFENYNLGALNEKVQLIDNILKEENTTYKIEELDTDSFYDEIKGYETLDCESAVLGITDKLNEVIRRINNVR